MMVETILMECLKGIGRMFANPLFYWIAFLVIGTGYQRVLQERAHFGFKIFNVFSELKQTWVISLVFSILISGLTLGAGMVFTHETILILSIVIIFLSITFSLSMLSASYTIGITYMIVLLTFIIFGSRTSPKSDVLTNVNFTGLVILLGIFLIVEAFLVGRVKRNDTFPELSQSERGSWIGKQHIKKLSFIPFFVLIPTGLIQPFADYWPFFTIGEDGTYGILLVPFIVGFDHVIHGRSAEQTTTYLIKSISLLGFIVLCLAVGSIYIPWLSMIAVLIAILGREYINYRHRMFNKEKSAYFNHMDDGLKVLSIIPGSPADRLGILVGETIDKVNDQKVNSAQQFYETLQNSGAYFKITLIDDANEMRFVQSAIYDNDHHELGIVFTNQPHKTH